MRRLVASAAFVAVLLTACGHSQDHAAALTCSRFHLVFDHIKSEDLSQIEDGFNSMVAAAKQSTDNQLVIDATNLRDTFEAPGTSDSALNAAAERMLADCPGQ